MTPKQALAISDSNTETQYKRFLSDSIRTPKKSLSTKQTASEKSQEKRTAKNISGFTRLLNTFKRVGFYRVARRAFQLIEQGFAQGLENIAKFSPDINKTLSSITSQFTVLANSVATVLVPLLRVAEPILKAITTTIGNVANVISYLIAKLSGSAEYLKVNTEYFKEFNKQASKFSFDKFEALNPEDDTANMFIEGKVADGLTEEMSEAKSILDAIGITLAGYSTITFVNWLMNKMPDTVKDIKKIKDSADSISSLKFTGGTTFFTLLATVGAGVGTFTLFDWLLKDADKTESMLITILGLIIAIGTAVAFAKSLATKNVAGAMASAIGAGAGLGMLVAGAKNYAQKSVQTYEDGGMVPRGSLFIAGESGAEFVTQMPSGQTGVTNVAQFKQAQLEALYEWWDYAKYDLPEGASFVLDGAVIARSKNFKAELNRTNSGLNLR